MSIRMTYTQKTYKRPASKTSECGWAIIRSIYTVYAVTLPAGKRTERPG